jgi:hypothetical protein
VELCIKVAKIVADKKEPGSRVGAPRLRYARLRSGQEVTMAAGTSFPSEDDAAGVVTSVITHHAAIGACVKTVQ